MSQKARKGFKDLEKIKILSKAEREGFKVPRRDSQPGTATAAPFTGKDCRLAKNLHILPKEPWSVWFRPVLRIRIRMDPHSISTLGSGSIHGMRNDNS
jgi:hypothetical protein